VKKNFSKTSYPKESGAAQDRQLYLSQNGPPFVICHRPFHVWGIQQMRKTHFPILIDLKLRSSAHTAETQKISRSKEQAMANNLGGKETMVC
jgi:hypothetical protein